MIVFVHGVPETAAIWRKVQNAIDRDSIALSLPGFGCARPDGFAATKDDYVEWLLGELDGISEPIDLVGHDWGAGFTYRIASAFGDRLRSWAADIANLGHPDYVWHAFAQIWQTPGEGEAFFETQNASTAAERGIVYEGFGLSPEDALEMASASDATMSQCILDLYRSATPNVHAHWGPWSPTAAPGLVIHPTADMFSEAEAGAEVARSFGAKFATIDAGHFWPYQAPEEGAAVLESFWASLS